MPPIMLNIDPLVLEEIKERAHREQRSLGEVISELLSLAMREESRSRKRKPFKWPSRNMEARFPMDDWSTVKDFLDAEDVAALRQLNPFA